jgi:hypothetical protein
MDTYVVARRRISHEGEDSLLICRFHGIRGRSGPGLGSTFHLLFCRAGIRMQNGRVPRVQDLRHTHAVQALRRSPGSAWVCSPKPGHRAPVRGPSLRTSMTHLPRSFRGGPGPLPSVRCPGTQPPLQSLRCAHPAREQHPCRGSKRMAGAPWLPCGSPPTRGASYVALAQARVGKILGVRSTEGHKQRLARAETMNSKQVVYFHWFGHWIFSARWWPFWRAEVA